MKLTLDNWKKWYSLGIPKHLDSFAFFEFYNLLNGADRGKGVQYWYDNVPKFRSECDYMFSLT